MGSNQFTKRFKTPNSLDRATPCISRDYRIRSGSCNRRRSDVRFKYNTNTTGIIQNKLNNTLNISDGAISGQGVPDKNMTVLIMTLNNTKQLFDMLGTLTPQAQGSNLSIRYQNFGIPNSAVNVHPQGIKSPSKIKDSLTLNSQRFQGRVDNIVSGERKNKTLISRLTKSNVKSIKPKKVQLHNLKQLNHHLKFCENPGQRDTKLVPTPRTKSANPTNKFKTIKFEEPKRSVDRRSNSRGTINHLLIRAREVKAQAIKV